MTDTNDIEEIIDAVMGSGRHAPKTIPMGANPPLFDGMQPDNDGPWVSRVDVAKRLRAALNSKAITPVGWLVMPKELTPEMLASASGVDFDAEDERSVIHNIWNCLSAARPSHVEYGEKLIAALEWYGEQARLCRLIHSEGDAGRHALSNDGGRLAREALSALPTPPKDREATKP